MSRLHQLPFTVVLLPFYILILCYYCCFAYLVFHGLIVLGAWYLFAGYKRALLNYNNQSTWCTGIHLGLFFQIKPGERLLLCWHRGKRLLFLLFLISTCINPWNSFLCFQWVMQLRSMYIFELVIFFYYVYSFTNLLCHLMFLVK